MYCTSLLTTLAPSVKKTGVGSSNYSSLGLVFLRTLLVCWWMLGLKPRTVAVYALTVRAANQIGLSFAV
jgi:hypothetical protein